MVSQNKIQGVLMLAMAAVCFWLPQHLKKPAIADQKLLVATSKLKDGVFDGAVVLVVQHNGYSAEGFILNKPGAGAAASSGGPAEPGTLYTLHTLDARDEKTVELKNIGLGYTEGEAFPKSFGATRAPPGAYIVLKGHAAWGFEQLGREINGGLWKVIDYDRDLAFRTDPARMHAEAVKKPAIVEYRD